jgi:hypothetical protein
LTVTYGNQGGKVLELVRTVVDSDDVFHLAHTFRQLGTVEASAYLARGEILSRLRDHKNYLKLGAHIKNMGDLYKELNITRKAGNHYERVYRRFKEYIESNALDISEVPLRRLIRLITVGDEDLGHMVEQAKVLNEKDFDDEVKMLKGKPSYLDCSHEEQEIHARCKRCGTWIK